MAYSPLKIIKQFIKSNKNLNHFFTAGNVTQDLTLQMLLIYHGGKMSFIKWVGNVLHLK